MRLVLAFLAAFAVAPTLAHAIPDAGAAVDMAAAVTVAPLQIITATSSSAGWQLPPWAALLVFAIVLGLLALLLRWAVPAIQASAFLKRHAMAQAILQRIAEAALVVVLELQQTKKPGASGAELLSTAVASVKDQLTGEHGAQVAAKILGVTPDGLDKIIVSNVEASVMQVKTAAQPAVIA